MEKLVLIDGNSLVNRAYYALPPLNAPDGTPVNAVYGFASMLIKVIGDIKPEYIAVAFDLSAPTFRHKRYDGYKATRKHMPDDLAAQLPVLKSMLGVMGIRMLEFEGFEADDIIGSMSKQNAVQTYIITGDRDSLQLIDDSTQVLLTKRGISDMHRLDAEELKKEFGLTPAQIIDYKAIAGDSSDNIPGVPGIGDKGANTLLGEYGDLDNIYAHIGLIAGATGRRLAENKELAYLSRELATIKTDMELNCPLSECKYVFPFSSQVHAFFVEMNFKTLLKRSELYAGIESEAHFGVKARAAAHLVQSTDELREIMARCGKQIAVAFYGNISFAFDEQTEYLVNLSFSLVDNGLDIAEVFDIMRPTLADNSVVKVVYDAKDFMHRIQRDFRFVPRGFTDVKLMQYLADMTVDYSTFGGLLATYSIDESEPATGLLFLRNTLDAELEKLGMTRLYYDVELPLADILFDMEEIGFRVDTAKLNELGQKYATAAEELAEQIFAQAGQRFNIKSPMQLGKVLFEDMGIEYPQKVNKQARGGKYSTAAEILEKVEEGNPVITLVLKYRFVTKLLSTYIEGLRPMIGKNGIVHTDFRQMLTTTGRLSSAEPNLQNIPVRTEEGKSLRAMFLAREGHTLVTADYSQIELRVMAHMSGDKFMTQAYLDGKDIHTSTAAQVFGVDESCVTQEMRRTAKAVNFGIIYGISDFGLAANLKISKAEAKRYIDNYFLKFEGVKKYLEESVTEARKTGSVRSLLGRVRKIPELFSSSFVVRQFGERAAMNMPIQGTAADIIKIAMLRVAKALEGKKSRLILQVHDELIVDADNSEVEEVRRILKENMESAMELSVPLTVDVGTGKNWLEC